MDNESLVYKAIEAVNEGCQSYCKFLSANDTGDTGAHQAGIYVAKKAAGILFREFGIKGQNKDRLVRILWQNSFTTESRFIYYGRGSRNEYRITRFEKNFPFLRPDRTGDLFVLVQLADEDYVAYIFATEEEINTFLDAFGLSPTDAGSLIQTKELIPEEHVDDAINQYISSLVLDFPPSLEMALAARRLSQLIPNSLTQTIINPDRALVSWIDMEYRLFRKIEFVRYRTLIEKGFSTVEEFIEIANMVLNRRKSRAGKSLEHHLASIFDENRLLYSKQPTTEGNKRPDFIFPSEYSYHNLKFPSSNLVFLGAKTTCKDRWRQILNEANRIQNKHLFTLQQGISLKQIEEMENEHVVLVVPSQYISAYPAEKRETIWSLKKFIAYTKETTSI